jgi:hypothetical protein
MNELLTHPLETIQLIVLTDMTFCLSPISYNILTADIFGILGTPQQRPQFLALVVNQNSLHLRTEKSV